MPRLINKKLIIASTIIIAIVLIVVSFTLTSKTPPTPPINPIFGTLPAPKLPSPQPQQQPPDQTTNFNNITLPKTITIYRQPPQTLTTTQATQLITSLGFTNIQTQQTFLTAQQESKSIIYNSKTGFLKLTQPLPPQLNPLSQETLENYTLQLIKQMVSPSIIWDQPATQIRYNLLTSPHESLPSSPANANLATLEVFPTIEGIRIISQTYPPFGEKGAATAVFNRTDKSITLTLSPINIDTSQTGTYPLKPITDIEKEVGSGAAQTTLITPQGKTYKDIEYGEVWTPTHTTFNHLELVYYYDGEPNNFLQPMYLITGTTTLTDGQSAKISAILPALDPQYLSP